MKALISRFLSKRRAGESAQQIRLSLVRFHHFLRQYGQIIALCEDAADKQSGEYIFDKAYVAALIDRAFGASEGMIYDLNALSGERYLGLYKDMETVRQKTTQLLETGSSTPLAMENEEEPEYWLLGRVREILCPSENNVPLFREGLTDPTFLGVLQFLLQEAGDLILETVRSTGFRRPSTEASAGRSFPIDTQITDLMNKPSVSGNSSSGARSIAVDSGAIHEFMMAFFAPAIWEDPVPARTDGQSASLVGCHLAQSMSVAVVHDRGCDLFDVFLGRAPASNYIYCRFPHGASFALTEGVLSMLGFFVLSTEHGLTGWIASQPLGETTATLRMVAGLSAFLLQRSTADKPQTVEETVRFLRMHGQSTVGG